MMMFLGGFLNCFKNQNTIDPGEKGEVVQATPLIHSRAARQLPERDHFVSGDTRWKDKIRNIA